MAKNFQDKTRLVVTVLVLVIFAQAVGLIFLSLRYRKTLRTLELYKHAAGVPVKKKIAKAKPKAPAAQVALVIDDWGYSAKNIPILDSIDVPLTLSILPSHSYSQAVSRYAQQRAWKVILHLPLEPQTVSEYVRPETNTLLTSMKKAEVLSILEKQLNAVDNIVGVSNHMGSKATKSEPLMKIIFLELHKRGLFFLDSIVTSASVGKKIAKEIGIGYLRRDVFLDNKQDHAYIARQFEELIGLAKRNGKAVGIAHDRKGSLTVLADILSHFDAEKEGIKFVPLSSLVVRN